MNDSEYVSKKQYKNKEELKEKIKRFLPRGTSIKVTDEILNMVDNIGKDTGTLDEYMQEKFFSYISVLGKGKFGLKSYIEAIKYCTLKKTMPNERAWEIVFPDKFKYLNDNYMSIANHVSMYNSNKLITEIDAMMLTELHLQYAPIFNEAITRSVDLMRGISPNGMKVSPTVQQQAAAKLIDVLAPPKEDKLSITVGADDETKKLQYNIANELKSISQQQKAMLESGASLSEIQKLNITVHKTDDIEDADIEEEE